MAPDNFFRDFNLWLHLISFALWIGAIFFFLFAFGPAVEALRPSTALPALNRGRKSFDTLAWIAIGLLLLTGLLNFTWRGAASRWHLGPVYYSILAVKLLLFAAMVLHQSLQTFKYGPRIVSLAGQLQAGTDLWPEPLLGLWKKWLRLLKINATLGPVVVLLGLALARS